MARLPVQFKLTFITFIISLRFNYASIIHPNHFNRLARLGPRLPVQFNKVTEALKITEIHNGRPATHHLLISTRKNTAFQVVDKFRLFIRSKNNIFEMYFRYPLTTSILNDFVFTAVVICLTLRNQKHLGFWFLFNV